jgi:uncharacterized protein YdaU (DUF1376 family)
LAALWHYWHHTHCTGLLDDDEQLRLICECPEADWMRTRGVLFSGPPFFYLDGGKWHQKRSSEEWEASQELYAKRLRQTSSATAARLRPKSQPDNVTSNVTSDVTFTKPQPQPQVQSQVQSQVQPQPQSHSHTPYGCESVRERGKPEPKRQQFDTQISFEQLQGELCQAYNRPVRVFGVSSEEYHLLAEIARRPNAKQEWRELKRFRDRMPAKDRRFFPSSAVRLLQAWDATLDRARTYQPDAQHQSLAEKQLQAAITEGFK